MEILFHVPLLIIARGLCSSVFTPKPHASGLGTTYCLNIYLCHQRRYICLLHILYNYFFSFFEISRFWLEMTTLCDCVIPKQSEGSLSLFLARAGRPRPYSCLVFFLLSFYHILFMTEKYAKGPGTWQKTVATAFCSCRHGEHSAGCCLPQTTFRSNIGDKSTRFPRNNRNANMHRSDSFYPIPDV